MNEGLTCSSIEAACVLKSAQEEQKMTYDYDDDFALIPTLMKVTDLI